MGLEGTKGGLVTYYLLFVMVLKTRRVHFAGATVHPDETWMKQIARNLTNFEDGFLNGKRYLLMDRDTKFCESFRDFLGNEGVESVRLPAKSPNLNAYAERWVLSIKSECLDHLIIIGERHLRAAVAQFTRHYHLERPHQGLGNELIEKPHDVISNHGGVVECSERLGGLLKHYYRKAA